MKNEFSKVDVLIILFSLAVAGIILTREQLKFLFGKLNFFGVSFTLAPQLTFISSVLLVLGIASFGLAAYFHTFDKKNPKTTAQVEYATASFAIALIIMLANIIIAIMI